MRALRPGGAHPPAPRPCVPEAAAWLPSTPGASPMPPAGSRPAAAPQMPGPSAAPESDICSRAASASAARHERLRKEPKAGRPRPARAGRSRAEPEAGRGSAPAPSGRGSPGGAGWQRGRGTEDYRVLF